ncbi:MAG: DUF4167 domain-containing protein [Hyphomicrobiales bacterium]|nr:DUF4167 domain-containing protein [Hyphomicrobiales bacterium]
MRQGHQNKRMRGRSRKAPNPLTRTFESNGPDVKIRGTALHIAEKYVSLARDAQSSGDPVASENYLQHAEHYFRIIAAAQPPSQPQMPTSMRETDSDESTDRDDRADAEGASSDSEPAVSAPGAPQPIEIREVGDSGSSSARSAGNGGAAPERSKSDDGEETPAPRRRGRPPRRTAEADGAEPSRDRRRSNGRSAPRENAAENTDKDPAESPAMATSSTVDRDTGNGDGSQAGDQ